MEAPHEPEPQRRALAALDPCQHELAELLRRALERLRPGGVILVDNVLWFGNVVNPEADDDDTRAIRAFNAKVAADQRVDRVMLAISDGLTVVRKR